MLQYIKFFLRPVLLIETYIFFDAESLTHIYLLFPTKFTICHFEVTKAFFALLHLIRSVRIFTLGVIRVLSVPLLDTTTTIIVYIKFSFKLIIFYYFRKNVTIIGLENLPIILVVGSGEYIKIDRLGQLIPYFHLQLIQLIFGLLLGFIFILDL